MGEDAWGCETGDMIVVHRLLRLLFTDAPALVRAVPDGDAHRTVVVADHVAEITGLLHHHHQTEDELLWEKLEARAPTCALHVGQMRAQHRTVGARLTELDETLPVWRASASRDDGDRVAVVLDRVLALLEEHLGREEETILPVAAATMTQKEWDVLGEHGAAAVPRDRQLIQLGWMLAAFPTPTERTAWVRANLPAMVRVLYALVGRRQFEANRRRLESAAPGVRVGTSRS